MSLRLKAGALLYDWPRFRRSLRSGRWPLMHNRDERITVNGRGVKCDWRFTSDLHIAKVFPALGRRLFDLAFADWPTVLRDVPEAGGDLPAVSFVIGHRGLDRLPHLLLTLRSIAGQERVPFECIVVEQDAAPSIERNLPSWVRYLFTASHHDYNRGAAFNAGAGVARGRVVILHDNDIAVPAAYAAKAHERIVEGSRFADLKRFLFHLDEGETGRVFATGRIEPRRISTVMQNAQGGSIAAEREAYFAIGGFDDAFVGWGGEDNDFWDRAATTDHADHFGSLPMVHLHHEPQAGKVAGADAPAVKRYFERESIPAEERIRLLLARRTDGHG